MNDIVKKALKSEIPRWRTAIVRRDISIPSRLALTYDLYNKSETILDYGCGRGFDVETLKKDGFDVKGYDPHFFANNPKEASDSVNIGFVLNVIEDQAERANVLKEAFALSKKRLIVSVRPDSEIKCLKEFEVHGDGVITNTGTFQKFFKREELGQYLFENTGLKPYLISSNIGVVFKDADAEKDFVAKYAEIHKGKKILPFEGISKMPPEETKTLNADELLLTMAIKKLNGDKIPHATDEEKAKIDKLINDSTDASALRKAISYASLKDKIGKNVGGTLYVHTSAKDRLPLVLRLMIARSQAALNIAIKNQTVLFPKSQPHFNFNENDATLFKLDKDGKSVSLLKYKDFNDDPHPALEKSVLVKFENSEVKGQDFSTRDNKPILHRKETFVAPDYPKYQEFAELTKAEEKAGLYEPAFLSKIGTENGWKKVLADKGVQINGHKVFSMNLKIMGNKLSSGR